MVIGKLMGRMPLVWRVHRLPLTRSFLNRSGLLQLGKTSYPQGRLLREVLERLGEELPQLERDWITRIEQERERLLGRNEPLVDGSLGAGFAMDAGKTIRRVCEASKGPRAALLLYLLVRATQPRNVLELGTNVGISSAYLGVGLKVNQANGKLTTLEGSRYRQRLAMEIHRNLELDNVAYVKGRFVDSLAPTLGKIGPVDLAFIDGNHNHQPTLDYFETILRSAAADAIFVFDDIRWSEGMEKAWARIQSDEGLGLIVDLGNVGICVRRREAIHERLVVTRLHVL